MWKRHVYVVMHAGKDVGASSGGDVPGTGYGASARAPASKGVGAAFGGDVRNRLIMRGDCGASTDREGREGLTANHGTISNVLAHEARPMLRIAERYSYRFVWPPAKL